MENADWRLIEPRFRYKPTKDAAGQPVADFVAGHHEWVPRGAEAWDKLERRVGEFSARDLTTCPATSIPQAGTSGRAGATGETFV